MGKLVSPTSKEEMSHEKHIAIFLAVLALSALTVTAFAAGFPEPETTEATATAKEKTTIAAALTEEQALAAALKDAGRKEADVTVESWT